MASPWRAIPTSKPTPWLAMWRESCLATESACLERRASRLPGELASFWCRRSPGTSAHAKPPAPRVEQRFRCCLYLYLALRGMIATATRAGAIPGPGAGRGATYFHLLLTTHLYNRQR